MLVIFEYARTPLCRPFKFKGAAGEGMVRRYGFLCFGICIVTGHDYFSYHEWVMEDAQLYPR